MKIALVHDYLVQNGGAEKVLEAFSEIFPYAPIYTLVYSSKLMQGKFSEKKIYTSFLQKVPFAVGRHRIFPQFMPFAIEQFDFSGYDIVLSDSSSFAELLFRYKTALLAAVFVPITGMMFLLVICW